MRASQARQDDPTLRSVGMGLGVATLTVVCCAGPLLLASVATGAAGAWLARSGAILAGAGVIVVAAGAVAVAVWRRG